MTSAAISDDDVGRAVTVATDPQTSHCEGMGGALDTAFANLCAEHCHQGQQSDQTASLTVPTVLLSALYATPAVPEPVVAPRLAANATSALIAASPPHTVLHCCFRI